MKILKLRRVKINKRTHNLVPGHNSDPDAARGILGFFEDRTIALGELYQYIDIMETMNPLVAQSTMWKKYLKITEEKNITQNKSNIKIGKGKFYMTNLLAEALNTTIFLYLRTEKLLWQQCGKLPLRLAMKSSKCIPLKRTRWNASFSRLKVLGKPSVQDPWKWMETPPKSL
jgi:hypothetical protein